MDVIWIYQKNLLLSFFRLGSSDFVDCRAKSRNLHQRYAFNLLNVPIEVPVMA